MWFTLLVVNSQFISSVGLALPINGFCSSCLRIYIVIQHSRWSLLQAFIHTCSVMVDRGWVLNYGEMNSLSETVVWAVSFFERDISSVECSHISVLCIVSNNQPVDSFSSTQPRDVSTAWVSPVFCASRSLPISSWLGALCILFYHRGKTFSLPIYD